MAELDQAAFWDDRYAEDGYLFGTAPNAFLAREVHRLTPASKVLAIADGEGRNSVFLAQHGHHVVSATGLSGPIQSSPKLPGKLYNSAISDSNAVRTNLPLAECKWG